MWKKGVYYVISVNLKCLQSLKIANVLLAKENIRLLWAIEVHINERQPNPFFDKVNLLYTWNTLETIIKNGTLLVTCCGII